MGISRGRSKKNAGPFILAIGVLALLAAALMSPQLLNHFKSLVRPEGSGTISASLARIVEAARLFLLAVSGILMVVGASPRGVLRVLVVAAAWLVVSLAIIQQAYPYNLFFRPRDLLRAALGEERLLGDYDPRSHLVVPSHVILRAKYPAVNIHAHFRYAAHQWTPRAIAATIQQCNVQVAVDLDGGLGKHLREEFAKFAAPYPGQVAIFATFWYPPGPISWDYFKWEVAHLEEAKQLGVRGVKIWKNIGMYTKDEHGKIIPLDDPRLEPMWNKIETLGLPILIHVSDPPMNFEPIDGHNESLDYLLQDAAISYHGPGVPGPEVVLPEFERVIKRHPGLTFIAAHLANTAYDLNAASQMLDRHKNLYMDISSRASDLGRQPVTARAFIIRYADRLLFGTDGNPTPKVYRGYFRLLETSDEYFDEPEWPEYKFGRWKLYGLALPDDVLRKVYHDNAARLLGLPLLSALPAPHLESKHIKEGLR